jgi:putative methyltransferase (TIGR04325 family)
MSEHPANDVPNYIWNGQFPTWAAALNAAKNVGVGGGLGGEQWFQRIKQQLLDYRSEHTQYGIAMPPRPCNLPLVCAMTSPKAIMDFGGSSGWCWDYLQNSVPNHCVNSYVVIETNEVVSYMTKARLHDSPVEFITISNTVNSSDLLYCNSVLQYFGSNDPLISLIKRTTPEYIFLEDLIAKSEEDFYTVQTFHNSGIPYRFIGLTKLLDELLCQGYVEVAKYPYTSPILGKIKPFEMGNFPNEKQVRYSLSVLLKKISIK